MLWGLVLSGMGSLQFVPAQAHLFEQAAVSSCKMKGDGLLLPLKAVG